MTIEVIGGKNWGGQLVEGSVLESVWHPMLRLIRPVHLLEGKSRWGLIPAVISSSAFSHWAHSRVMRPVEESLLAGYVWSRLRTGEGRWVGETSRDCPRCSPTSLRKTAKSTGLLHVIFGQKCGYAIPHSLMWTCFNCVKPYFWKVCRRQHVRISIEVIGGRTEVGSWWKDLCWSLFDIRCLD